MIAQVMQQFIRTYEPAFCADWCRGYRKLGLWLHNNLNKHYQFLKILLLIIYCANVSASESQ